MLIHGPCAYLIFLIVETNAAGTQIPSGASSCQLLNMTFLRQDFSGGGATALLQVLPWDLILAWGWATDPPLLSYCTIEGGAPHCAGLLL